MKADPWAVPFTADQLDVIAGLLRGAFNASQQSGERSSNPHAWACGAWDSLNEFTERARVLWGDEFAAAWQASRPPEANVPRSAVEWLVGPDVERLPEESKEEKRHKALKGKRAMV